MCNFFEEFYNEKLDQYIVKYKLPKSPILSSAKVTLKKFYRLETCINKNKQFGPEI